MSEQNVNSPYSHLLGKNITKLNIINDDELKKLYLKKVILKSNLLPEIYREKFRRSNLLFFFIGTSIIATETMYRLKNIKQMGSRTWKGVFMNFPLIFIYVIGYLIYNRYMQKKAFTYLKEKYNNEHIFNVINENKTFE